VQCCRRRTGVPLLAAAAVVVGSFGTAARGAVLTWNGAQDAEWYSAAQWTPGAVPSASDELVVTSGRPVTNNPSASKIRVSNGGSITVSGASAALGAISNASNTAPDLAVGVDGAGRVLVEGGARLTTGAVDLGVNEGSRGEVTLQGPGSMWTANVTHFHVGDVVGEGVLNVLDGASIDYFSELDVAYGRRSTGTVTVDHANFTVGQFDVGDGGHGVMAVRNRGAARSNSTFVAYYRDTDGRLDVGGAGSSLIDSGSLVVGRFGRGEVNVTDGATVRNGESLIAGDQTGQGTVAVTGPGSTIASTGSVVVGGAGAGGGRGELRLASGATVSAGADVTLSGTSVLSFIADETGAGLLTAARAAVLAGELSFDFAPGYLPPAGTRYELITAGSVSGRFSAFVTDEPVELVYGPGTVSVQVVPEPGAGAVVGLGALGWLAGRRRRGAAYGR
jgi:T5SS/PEP-CTERM-associated repeat protein